MLFSPVLVPEIDRIPQREKEGMVYAVDLAKADGRPTAYRCHFRPFSV